MATIFVDIQKLLPDNINNMDVSILKTEFDNNRNIFEWIYTPRWKERRKLLEEHQKKIIEEKQSNYKHLPYNKTDNELDNDKKKEIIFNSKKPLLTPSLYVGMFTTWRICEKCDRVISHYQTTDELEGSDVPYLCMCRECAKK